MGIVNVGLGGVLIAVAAAIVLVPTFRKRPQPSTSRSTSTSIYSSSKPSTSRSSSRSTSRSTSISSSSSSSKTAVCNVCCEQLETHQRQFHESMRPYTDCPEFHWNFSCGRTCRSCFWKHVAAQITDLKVKLQCTNMHKLKHCKRLVELAFDQGYITPVARDKWFARYADIQTAINMRATEETTGMCVGDDDSNLNCCPECGIACEKVSGCPYVECAICNTAFKWCCGKRNEDCECDSDY